MSEGEGIKLNTKIPTLEIKGYTKKFKKFLATKDVNFNVGHGVIHGFIGPNGAGKTTTIKAIIGAYIPTKGGILVNGNKAGSINANKLIGYIPERASFPSHLNSIQYLISMAELSGIKSKEARRRAKLILEALGLLSHARRKPGGFSSGMQKKILLAQSLLTNPSILVLDEPAANLDPTARKDLFNQLIQLRKQGKTIFISSHILAELERIVDEVTFIYYGEVIYSGKVDELTKMNSDVFIKSDNNEKLYKYLKNKKYKMSGDVKTEIVVDQLSRDKVKKLFNDLAKSKIAIISFRSNDLQAVYDYLLEKSHSKNKGVQKVGKVKAIAMNKGVKKSRAKKGNK